MNNSKRHFKPSTYPLEQLKEAFQASTPPLEPLTKALQDLAEDLPPTIQAEKVTKINIDGDIIRISLLRIDAGIKELMQTSQELSRDNSIIVLGGVSAGRANVVITAGKKVIEKGFKSNDVVKASCALLGGGGGGRPERAQGGGPNVEKIDEALELGVKLSIEQLKGLKQRREK